MAIIKTCSRPRLNGEPAGRVASFQTPIEQQLSIPYSNRDIAIEMDENVALPGDIDCAASRPDFSNLPLFNTVNASNQCPMPCADAPRFEGFG